MDGRAALGEKELEDGRTKAGGRWKEEGPVSRDTQTWSRASVPSGNQHPQGGAGQVRVTGVPSSVLGGGKGAMFGGDTETESVSSRRDVCVPAQ